jgi:hypothetical protein
MFNQADGGEKVKVSVRKSGEWCIKTSGECESGLQGDKGRLPRGTQRGIGLRAKWAARRTVTKTG